MALNEPIAQASLPEMRARMSPGTAMAAMNPDDRDDDQQLDERESVLGASFHVWTD
jgi:hypothetical protein